MMGTRVLQNNIRLILTLLLTMIASIGQTPAYAQQAIPPYQAFVTDITNTLSTNDKRQLEQRLDAIHQQNLAEMAILVVPTTQPETIFTYSMRVAEQWQVGSKKKDDGVLIVIALQDRTTQILVGYGLEDRITDLVASQILRDVIPPYFRRGDFSGGLNATVTALTSVIQGESLPPASQSQATSQPSTHKVYKPITTGLAIVYGVWTLFARMFLRNVVGKVVAGIATLGVITGASLFAGLPIGTFAIIAVALALFVMNDSRGTINGGRPRYSSGGFRSGGFGGGGGGFKGGGGGRFGGGGASGRW